MFTFSRDDHEWIHTPSISIHNLYLSLFDIRHWCSDLWSMIKCDNLPCHLLSRVIQWGTCIMFYDPILFISGQTICFFLLSSHSSSYIIYLRSESDIAILIYDPICRSLFRLLLIIQVHANRACLAKVSVFSYSPNTTLLKAMTLKSSILLVRLLANKVID